MEGDSTQEPRAEAVDAVAEPGLVESFVGNYPTHYILGNDDEVGQRCSANFAMADSAELAKEGKLAEFVEQSFGDKLGDDEGDAGDGAAVAPRPAPPLAVGDVVRHKAWGEGTVTEAGPTEVSVDFGDRECRFAVPDAIERGYLTLAED